MVPVWMQTVAPSSSLRRGHAELLGDHEALTVVVVDADEIELQVDVAAEGPGGVPGQHVDLARGERGEAGLAGGRDEFDCRRVAENGGGDGAADGDVEALPVAVGVGRGKADQTGGHATVQRATRLDVVERCRGRKACGQRRQRPARRGIRIFSLFTSSWWTRPYGFICRARRTLAYAGEAYADLRHIQIGQILCIRSRAARRNASGNATFTLADSRKCTRKCAMVSEACRRLASLPEAETPRRFGVRNCACYAPLRPLRPLHRRPIARSASPRRIRLKSQAVLAERRLFRDGQARSPAIPTA